MDGAEKTCCVCGMPCGVTPSSRDAKGATICIKCSAAGKKPPSASGPASKSAAPRGFDDEPIEVEGYTEKDVAILSEDQRAPRPAAGPHPTESFVRSSTLSKRVCEQCKASLTGDENLCPACGHLCKHFTSKARIAEENRKDYEEYDRKFRRFGWSLLAVGVVLTVGTRFAGRTQEELLEDAKHLIVGVPAGLLCYYLACVWFFGFDGKLIGPMARLAASYVALNGLFVLMIHLPVSGCISLIMIPAVLLLTYLFLLRRALELDYLEAGMFLVPSACVIFGAIVLAWHMKAPS
jgi:hypothetical protein